MRENACKLLHAIPGDMLLNQVQLAYIILVPLLCLILLCSCAATKSWCICFRYINAFSSKQEQLQKLSSLEQRFEHN